MVKFSHIADFEIRNNKLEAVNKLAELSNRASFTPLVQTRFATSRNSLVDSLTKSSSLLSQLHSLTEIKVSQVLPNLKILNMDAHWTAEMSTTPNKFLESSLFNSRLEQVLRHLKKLEDRVLDTTSRVLITGDLNAGKSSLANALLKRPVLPVDQQPCTKVFCEVVDCSLNANIEEVHGIIDIEGYSPAIRSSFAPFSFAKLPELVKSSKFKLLKIYFRDPRPANISLLANGIADIRLIDAPGLNVSQLTTADLFGKQEEIDLVIFVVNAENHFTQSSKDFVSTAAAEKSLLFIAVNKIDKIPSNEQQECEHTIKQQIRELVPETAKNSANQIFFTNGTSQLPPPPQNEGNDNDPDDSNGNETDEISRLESNVRNFVLNKRSQTKLMPAKKYVLSLMDDISDLMASNCELYTQERTAVSQKLAQLVPVLQAKTDELNKSQLKTNATCDQHLKSIVNSSTHSIKHSISKTEVIQPQLTGINWLEYTRKLKGAHLATIQQTVELCELNAFNKTNELISQIYKKCPDGKIRPTVQTQPKPASLVLNSNLQFSDFFRWPAPFLTLNFKSLSMLASGATFASMFRYIPTSALIARFGLVKTVLVFTASLGFTGLVYYTQNFKKIINQNIVSKLQTELTPSYVHNLATKIASNCEQMLKQPLIDLQTSFQVHLNDFNRQKLQLDQQSADLSQLLASFEKCRLEAQAIRQATISINLD